MSELETSFEKLLGRQPTDAERQELYRVRDALELKSNDALWLVLMALQHYQHQYERMPNAIAEASSDILAKFREASASTAREAAEEANADLAKAISTTAQQVANDTARKQKTRWIAIAVAVITITFTGGWWYAFNTGMAAGRWYGYEEAKNETAAASWANTPEGKLAYKLATAGEGNIDVLAKCNRPGWIKRDGFCYVQISEDGKIYGWRLPK
jgi:hypothetical protein